MTTRHALIFFVLAALILLSLPACGSDEAQTEEGLIGPDGGELTAHDVTVTIPAGALSETVRLSIQPVDSPDPAGYLVVGPFVRLEPSQVELAKPVTVTVPIDEALLPAGRSLDEALVITAVEFNAAFTALDSSPTDDGRLTAMLNELGLVGAAVAQSAP